MYCSPETWDITKFIKKDYLPSRLRCFHIRPVYVDRRQKEEWRKFLQFLKQYEKVALAETENFQFYILPPCSDGEFSHAVVMYTVTKCQNHVTSEIRSESDGFQLEHSKRGSKYDNRNPPDCNSEEMIGDNQAPQSKVETCSRSVCSATMQTGPAKNYMCAHPSYLKTLGQTHSDWIFGAVAELVDNSRDAKATKLDISIDMIYSRIAGKEIPMLAVVDDGHGMSHQEIMKMVSFGRKQPDTSDSNYIGRYGVGFKNIEIPIVTYSRKGQFMELDTKVQAEALAKRNLKAVMEFSPFNKYFIGEKAGLFQRKGTGTQIYIWNLDEWGSKYSLEWVNGMSGGSSFHQGDIFICSRRVRSRLGQMTQQVPLDYSLRSYLEVIFLDPRMKIYVQGSLVKSRPLARFLHKTSIENGFVLGKPVQLILGHSQLDLEQGNCGIFLYWHGRLIEAYKRVGSMIYNGEKSHGIVGVIDVTNVMDDASGRVWVHNNKQGFVDCEPYALLEDWLSKKADEYLDTNFDKVHVTKGGSRHKPDHEWVQCDKCRKWRMLDPDFDSKQLPQEWFCYMKPINGKCEMPEQKLERGVITISSQRSGYIDCNNLVEQKKVQPQLQTQGNHAFMVCFLRQTTWKKQKAVELTSLCACR
ncbi:MORC family CW-type zinc finger protein 2B-like isoform X2 [Cynara cardunculus var. scolymus]|uniref:MORC family CW-type zinc finger protein 2B-like isoform X2 n=1 Tax=Cynara cardunculus var. scolymus TaxID=59895 RepID=UPI000D627D53|nr:MORC family CW-type zinc finger protein 2B-like isoform X2 [Cynara cardunculus var. scolymus]